MRSSEAGAERLDEMLSRFSKGIPSQVAICIGMTCLTLSLLAERFLPSTSGLDFLCGMLVGLSITMNLWGIFRWRPQTARSGR